VIINTCGWVEGLGLELLCHVIAAFRADVVLVVNDEALVARLSHRVPTLVTPAPGGMPTTVVKLPVSGGVRRRSKELRQAARKSRLREYFYGPSAAAPEAALELTPNTGAMSFDALRVVRIGGAKVSPRRSLPPVARTRPAQRLRASFVPGSSPFYLADGRPPAPDRGRVAAQRAQGGVG